MQSRNKCSSSRCKSHKVWTRSANRRKRPTSWRKRRKRFWKSRMVYLSPWFHHRRRAAQASGENHVRTSFSYKIRSSLGAHWKSRSCRGSCSSCRIIWCDGAPSTWQSWARMTQTPSMMRYTRTQSALPLLPVQWSKSPVQKRMTATRIQESFSAKRQSCSTSCSRKAALQSLRESQWKTYAKSGKGERWSMDEQFLGQN